VYRCTWPFHSPGAHTGEVKHPLNSFYACFSTPLTVGVALAAMLQTACTPQLAGMSSPYAASASDAVSAREGPSLSRIRVLPAPMSGASWMATDAKPRDLLYISDIAANVVDVFTYPGGKVVGQLTGFNEPAGLCSDTAGNVWVPNYGSNTIVEYRHGGKTIVATLRVGNQKPDGCAVDPRTGDLAVANYQASNGGPGNLAVFKHARGRAKYYTTSSTFYGAFCGYDNRGNLFVDALSKPSTGFLFAELAKGSGTLTSITLSGGTIYYPGAVQWDGRYVAVGDQSFGGHAATSGIYQTTGAAGQIVGSTALNGSGRVAHWWIQKGTVIAPSLSNFVVRYYKYPAGGDAIKVISDGFEAPSGAAVSVSGIRR
jgi:hypothetical protein